MGSRPNDVDIHRALKAGARGYLLKDAVRREVADAIHVVHGGGKFLPITVAQRLAEFTPRIDLKPKEVKVLELMATGLSNRDIAAALFRSQATVKVHVHHILSKLGATDRTEAVVVALQRGIIHLPEADGTSSSKSPAQPTRTARRSFSKIGGAGNQSSSATGGP